MTRISEKVNRVKIRT